MPPRKSIIVPSIHGTARYLLSHLQLVSEESGQHSRRLCALSLRLGRTMGLQNDELSVLLYGTMLHDVGKMHIPLEILHKEGKLTTKECHIMREHSQLGATMARARKFPDEICSAIMFHHEKWNGTGYPWGLKGESIPLTARIIAVVDTFDTIVYKRCWRGARAIEIARSEIVRCTGTQFDPHVAESFISLLEVIAARRGVLAVV